MPFEGIAPMEVAQMKFDAFNDGFEGDSLAQNFTNCHANFLILNYLEYPTFKAKFIYGSGAETVRNSTILMHNASYPLNYCTDALEQIYYYMEGEAEIYGSTTGYLRAAMLNMFANAIRV